MNSLRVFRWLQSFEKTCHSHYYGSSNLCLRFLDLWKWKQYVVPRVSKQLTTEKTWHPRKAKSPSSPRRKPKNLAILLVVFLFVEDMNFTSSGWLIKDFWFGCYFFKIQILSQHTWQSMLYSFVYITLCKRTWYAVSQCWWGREFGVLFLALCFVYGFIKPTSAFRGTSISCALQAVWFPSNSISFSYFRFLEPYYLESLRVSP
jgi:hypothetical protein